MIVNIPAVLRVHRYFDAWYDDEADVVDETRAIVVEGLDGEELECEGLSGVIVLEVKG